MASVLVIDNFVVKEPILNILYKLQSTLTNGKLRDIKPGYPNIVVTCPVHADGLENKAAMSIYIGDNPQIKYGLCRCFVCGFTSSFEGFVAKCFNSSIDFAKEWLRSNFGTDYDISVKLEDNIIIKPSAITPVLSRTNYSLYQDYCPYLQKRKLSRETCERFGVKYDSQARQVVFPVFDEQNRFVLEARRSIDVKNFHMTENTKKPVYCLNEILNNHISTAVICEGLIDCLTGWEYGVPTIATLGEISPLQIEKINRSCLTKLYLCMDNDQAGRRFTEVLKRRLSSRLLLIPVNIPKPAKDINDLSKEQFLTCLASADNYIKI